jgi:hypothetical protein
MNYSEDPRVIAVRTDEVINDENGTWTVGECYSDQELVEVLDRGGVKPGWGDPEPAITTPAAAVEYFRQLESIWKDRRDDMAGW